MAIVGQTASGKTSLSIDIAKQFDGEVISCDSRQVYRGLNIGSGKVTTEEMRGVRHHLLDVVDLDVVYTAVDFKRDAEAAIADINGRDKLPIIAGGTFFYLDQLRGLSTPPVAPNEALRTELESHATEDLFSTLQKADPRRAATIDPHNRHRLIRALEIIDALGSVPELATCESEYDWFIAGIDIEQSVLDTNIHIRLVERLESGMIEEVANLLEHTPPERLLSLGLEYRYVTEYLRGALSKEELVTVLQAKIRQFSRRQLTWLKRDKDIRWYKKSENDRLLKDLSAWLKA